MNKQFDDEVRDYRKSSKKRPKNKRDDIKKKRKMKEMFQEKYFIDKEYEK